ncbi:MAG: histidine phosphatase family protein [Actinobacteria bacterium]|nr:histidine phosphatase family protein [Actinomycetota bacterium]
MKTLLVMRHAKSDWAAEHHSDHERPLSKRGVEAARQMGLRLTRLGLTPDRVISSTAVRARTTALLAAESGEWEAAPTYEPLFYGTGPDTVLGVVAGLDRGDRLLIVGHQPTWAMIVSQLTGELVEMKTATVAVVTSDAHVWTDLVGRGGTLTAVHHPAR